MYMSEIMQGVAISSLIKMALICVIAQVFEWVMLGSLLIRKNPLTFYFILFLYKLIIINTIFCGILSVNYEDEPWFIFGLSMAITINIIVMLYMLNYTYEGGLAKIFTAIIFTEIFVNSIMLISSMLIEQFSVGESYMLVYGQMRLKDLLIPVIFSAIFFPIYFVLRKTMNGFRYVKLKHERFFNALTVFFLFTSYFNIFSYAKRTNVKAAIMLLGYPFGFGFLLSLFLIWYFRRLHEKIQGENEFLKRNQRVLDTQYTVMQSQIGKMKSYQKELDEQMKALYHIMKKGDNTEQFEEYLGELTNQYQKTASFVFTDDYVTNALLSYYVGKCQEKQIKTDLLFQEYQQDSMEKAHFLELISKLFETALHQKDLKKIMFHVSDVKNSIMFVFMLCFDSNNKKRKKHIKKDVGRYAKPYCKQLDVVEEYSEDTNSWIIKIHILC